VPPDFTATVLSAVFAAAGLIGFGTGRTNGRTGQEQELERDLDRRLKQESGGLARHQNRWRGRD